MQLPGMDREGIKAELRRRHGSVFEFERKRQLPARSVSDTLRGRPNERVMRAIQQELGIESSDQSDKSDSAPAATPHCLNAEAR